jgi:hypothetical protein
VKSPKQHKSPEILAGLKISYYDQFYKKNGLDIQAQRHPLCFEKSQKSLKIMGRNI